MELKELQIIKHSLQRYVIRTEATKKEIEEEKRVLGKITNQVELLKEKYGISRTEANGQ